MGSCKIFLGLGKIFLGSGKIFLDSGKIFLDSGNWESCFDKFHAYNKLRNWFYSTFLLRDTANVYSNCNSIYSGSHSLWFESRCLIMDMVEDELLFVDIQVPPIKDEDFIVAVIFVIVFLF